jgi:hypothetical protein
MTISKILLFVGIIGGGCYAICTLDADLSMGKCNGVAQKILAGLVSQLVYCCSLFVLFCLFKALANNIAV